MSIKGTLEVEVIPTTSARTFPIIEGDYYAVGTMYNRLSFTGCTVLAQFGGNNNDYILLANTTGTADCGGNNLYSPLVHISVE